MGLWQLWCFIGLAFLVIEMFAPTMFFLNLGLACFASAIAAYFGASFLIQVIVFAVFAAVFLVWLRPFILSKKQADQTEEKYKGKTAVVTEKVTHDSGRIAIYGETWQVKSVNDEEIDVDAQVKIVDRDGIIMHVEKI